MDTAPRPPPEKSHRRFQARCNACGGKLSSGSFLTSCRHFVCEACCKGDGECPVCHQQARTIRVSAANFPPEIKERSNWVMEAALGRAMHAAMFQWKHLYEVSRRQQAVLQKVQADIQKGKAAYHDLEQRYKKLKAEGLALRKTAQQQADPHAHQGGGGIYQPVLGAQGFGDAGSLRAASVSSVGSLLGKTLMSG